MLCNFYRMKAQVVILLLTFSVVLCQPPSRFRCSNDQYFFNSRCRRCPNNARPSNDQSTCICRNNNAQFDVVRNICQRNNRRDQTNNGRCTNNQVWNGERCICPSGQARYGTCRTCPSGSLPNSLRTSCKCTNSNQIFSEKDFSCLACPASKRPNRNSTECICKNGYTLVGNNCILRCGRDEVANQATGRCDCKFGFTRSRNTCVARCRQNQQWNGKNCICQEGFISNMNQCRRCPSGGSSNSARDSCTCLKPDFIFNRRSWQCQACPRNKVNSDDDTKCICRQGFTQSGNECITDCGINQQINLRTKVCECKFGFLKLGDTCVERCGINSQWNGKQCICKAGYAKLKGTCRPCPGGSKPNSERTACICQNKIFRDDSCVNIPANSYLNSDSSDFICIKGYNRQGDSCTFNCPSGASPNAQGVCVCTGGLVLQGNTCKQPIQCPVGSTWNPRNLQCVCSQRGKFLIQGQCTTCDQGSIYSRTQKRCICSTGFFRIGGICRVCDPRTKYNGTDCVCNLGYFGDRDKCQKCHPTCSVCSGPEANQCSQCSDVSLVLQNGYCKKQLCDAGLFFNTQEQVCQKCLDNCINCDNIFECKTCAIGYDVKTEIIEGERFKLCAQVCGDGIRYEQLCDDNNLRDGDGCSSTCTIEQGWTCQGGSSGRKTICNKFTPDQVNLKAMGAVNLGSRVVQSIRASYIPTCLSKNDCNQCFKLIKANVVEGKVPILVKINYVPFSQYQFLIEYDFQVIVTSIFKVVIRLNQQLKGCLSEEDYDQQLEIEIDPVDLAKVDQTDELSLDDILQPSNVANKSNQIKIPDEAKRALQIK